MLYQKYETDISQENLCKVFSKVPEPLCLLGGWAVYLTVNDSFKECIFMIIMDRKISISDSM